jgi:hypothetical protein
MNALPSVATPHVRRNAVSSMIAMVLGLSPAVTLAAASWPVTSCEDDGTPGTLRSVIAAGTTASGDTVDLSALVCTDSLISLQTGAIEIKQDDLTLIGPGAAALQVDGAKLPYTEGDYRIFTHTGTGKLTLQALGVAHGHVYHAGDGNPARGGCIYSAASVQLDDAAVTKCSAYSAKNYVRGGALIAYGDVTVNHSTLSANSATSINSYAQGGGVWAKGNVSLFHAQAIGNAVTTQDTFPALGGGIFANGDLSLSYSTLSGNSAAAQAYQGSGGGADVYGGFSCGYSTIDGNSALGNSKATSGGGGWIHGNATIKRCTISNNHSDGVAGGVLFADFIPGPHTVDMRHSTISGNSAGTVVGGMASSFSSTLLYNTTIAFNSAVYGTGGAYSYGPGLALSAYSAAITATLSSSLLSNNTYGAGIEMDLTAAATILHPITFNSSPANNLIRSYLASGLPDDTIAKSCPLLGPLRDNGGPTRTHALLSGSAAIDVGNNVNGDDQDQRGLATDSIPYLYPRVSNLVADIGAYEVNQDDITFNNGFDGCPDLN